MQVNVLSDQQEDASFKHYAIFGSKAPWDADDKSCVECASEEDAHKLKGIVENALPSESKWPWVKVSERTPELVNKHEESIVNNARCGAYDESDRCMVIVNGRVADSRYVYWHDTGDHHWQMLSAEVTHWMPYPDTDGS